MSVKGDLVAAMTTKGMSEDEARTWLTFIFDHAADPNFAYKYADEETSGATRSHPDHNEQMHNYFNVVEFLRAKI